MFISFSLHCVASRPALTHGTTTRRRCDSRLLLPDVLRCTCHLTFHSGDGQGRVSTFRLSRGKKKGAPPLISSVPHAVLDDKMATAAVLAALMWGPDSTNFIYCQCAGWSVTHDNLLLLPPPPPHSWQPVGEGEQPRAFSPGDGF